jgi:hypothetical protein
MTSSRMAAFRILFHLEITQIRQRGPPSMTSNEVGPSDEAT